MYVWEITINLDDDYEEVSDAETQEAYHTFINDLVYGYDTYFQAKYLDEHGGIIGKTRQVILEFGATTKEKLQEIIETHTEIFKNVRPREKPLNIEYKIYEL